MSVGTSLQSIRSAAGLSVAQLATKSRIPASVIADLERDDFSTCGGAAYARGHIRTISRICGADTEAILAQFESQTIPLSKSIRDLLNDTNVTRPKPERKPLSWNALAVIAAALIAVVAIGATTFSNDDGAITSIQVKESEKSSEVATKTSGVSVTLTGVNGLSWVAISDSTGTTQYSGRIRQGESRTFTDNQLIYVVIGNAGAINLKVNGEDLGIPGAVGEVVRLEFGPQAQSQQG